MHSRILKEFPNFANLSILALLFAFAEVAKAQEPPTLSVCDVFKDLQSWSGKQIAVRGELDFSIEIYAVSQRNCPVAFETEGIKWATAITLGIRTPESDIPEADLRSLRFLRNLTGLLMKTYLEGRPSMVPPFQISGTFIGTLRTRDSYAGAMQGSDGLAMITGFGHMGRFPARLEIIAVRDVMITGLQTKPSADANKPEQE